MYESLIFFDRAGPAGPEYRPTARPRKWAGPTAQPIGPSARPIFLAEVGRPTGPAHSRPGPLSAGPSAHLGRVGPAGPNANTNSLFFKTSKLKLSFLRILCYKFWKIGNKSNLLNKLDKFF